MPCGAASCRSMSERASNGLAGMARRRFDAFARELRWLGRPLRSSLLAISAFVLFSATLSWQMPLLGDVEQSISDLASAISAPRRESDQRIAKVVFNDDTLRRLGEVSPLDRTTLARALALLDGMGARGIAVDVLVDSKAPDDPLLIETLRAMRTPTYVAYARLDRRNYLEREQQAVLDRFIAAVRSDRVRPASIRIDTDERNVVRRWPVQPTDMPLLANAFSPPDPAFADGGLPILFRMPRVARRAQEDIGNNFDVYPIDVFVDDVAMDEAGRAAMAELLRGKIVLVGAELQDRDRFQTPISTLPGQGLMAGIDVHAHMLAQRLDNLRATVAPVWLQLGGALGCFLAGGIAAILLAARPVARWCARVMLSLALLAAVVLLPEPLQITELNGAGWVFAFLAGSFIAALVPRWAASEKGRAATHALTRYLPPDIAKAIVTDPDQLGLNGERRDLFALFTDLEGFTTLCHAVEPAAVAAFLNDYLETLSQVVLAHGGTIDKFVGDAVVAFWGAPIAHPDDGERAMRCAIALWRASETFRGTELAPGCIVGRTRVGLHYGPAIIGNFGGDGRLQYTALGDTMNVAARLEAENKRLGTAVLVSQEAFAHALTFPARRMGRVQVRGRSTPLEIWEPALDLPDEDVARLNAFYDAASAGDAAALAMLEQWVADHPADRGTASLIERLRFDLSEASS